ncbi:hypothetical protein JT31_10565 [Cedecea neteri]|uniref:Uncharacterized protein n=1 Tax=Cedecea neteri TaxID=158822 RepID=A0A089REW5_9ENTR|nr:hypothetical protein JT31_10565 [Cedecea neteri]
MVFFHVFLSSLRFLSNRFYCFFMMLFSRLSLLCCRRFYCFFVVLFGSLSFLLGRWLSGFFMMLFSGLSFLNGSFFVFLMVRYFCRWNFSSRCSGGGCRSSGWCGSGSVSSESSGRQTHSSGNNQS